MAEYNEIEDLVIPENPKVIDDELLHLYMPIAGYSQRGIAQFDPVDFVLDKGVVKSRKQKIADFNDADDYLTKKEFEELAESAEEVEI